MTAADHGGWTLRYSRRAERDIARLDAPIRRRILTALGQLAEDPAAAAGLRKLSGRSESRLRVGDWRVILDVAAASREIYVHRVLPRGRAYDR
ncbi:MAG: type II toxin-antitoxin system RelE family toxin [Gammaproteobacteria bacterium]